MSSINIYRQHIWADCAPSEDDFLKISNTQEMVAPFHISNFHSTSDSDAYLSSGRPVVLGSCRERLLSSKARAGWWLDAVSCSSSGLQQDNTNCITRIKSLEELVRLESRWNVFQRRQIFLTLAIQSQTSGAGTAFSASAWHGYITHTSLSQLGDSYLLDFNLSDAFATFIGLAELPSLVLYIYDAEELLA